MKGIAVRLEIVESEIRFEYFVDRGVTNVMTTSMDIFRSIL